MNLTEALNLLRHYQLWRLGEEITELNPKQITEAISVVISAAKWQQERMYSEEDILEAMKWARTFSSKMNDVDFIKLYKK